MVEEPVYNELPAVAMIKFSCRCKHAFELPEEMAGRQVQCPACMLLVDVPTQDEMAQLAEDGTFRIEGPVATEPQRFAELKRTYSREKVDEQGVEFDLRQTPEQLAAAGTDEPSEGYEAVPFAPKYDPETGELIRPLDMREDALNRPPHPSAIPLAQTALNYASADMNPSVSFISPLLQLLMPINLAAMFFVLAAHIFLVLAMFSMFLAVFAILVVGAGLVAHYSNVVEEVAIEERDELPRFLRHFSLADDIWLPFIHVFLAWMICFGPGIAVWAVGTVNAWPVNRVSVVRLVLNLVGLIFFPAIALTTITSGTMSNLRPDRILGTIVRIGPRYILLAIIYAAAILVYYKGLAGTVENFTAFFFGGVSMAWFKAGLIAYGLLILGIYLMHYFAWVLGLCYRSGHNDFPWLFQHHVRMIPGVTAPRYASPIPKPPAEKSHVQ